MNDINQFIDEPIINPISVDDLANNMIPLSVNNTATSQEEKKTFSRNKDPPPLHDTKKYDDWKTLLKYWQIYTTIPLNMQGSSLILALRGEAQDAALELPEAKIACNDGIKNILDKLDTIYKKDITISKLKFLEDFEDYKRTSDTTIDQYLIEFEKRLHKTEKHGTTWSSDVLALKLLKNANLPETQQQMAKATLSTLTYKDMKTKLKNIFGESKAATKSNEDFTSELIHYTEDTMYDNNSFTYDNTDDQYVEYENQHQQEEQQFTEETNNFDQIDYENTYMAQNFRRPQFRPRFPQPRQWRPQQYSSPRAPRYFSNQNQQQRFNSNPRRFYTQQGASRIPQNNNPRFNNNPRINPPSRCSICQSINHWAQYCPEKNRNSQNTSNTFFSNIDI